MTSETQTPENPANTATPVAPAKSETPKTVAADMPQRRTFPTPDEAEAYLGASSERYADFAEQTFAARSLVTVTDDEGNETGVLDREVYEQPGFETMVSLLRKRGKAGEVKAIVVAPVPTLELLLFGNGDAPTAPDGQLPDTPGVAFVRGIVHKELNHRAVKPLRDAEDVSTVLDQIPTTVDGYISSGRESGGLMEPFDELYADAIKVLAKKVPAFAKRRFTKPEFRKACESKGYALATYREIEEAGVNGSLFERALHMMKGAAQRKGMGTEIFDRWLATRESRAYDETTDEAEVELDLDDLTESMLADDAKPAEQTEAQGEQTEQSDAPTDSTEAAPTEQPAA